MICPQPPPTLIFDRSTLKLVQVTSKVGNRPSKFGHARPLRSRIIHYVRDKRTDGRTKATEQQEASCILTFDCLDEDAVSWLINYGK